MLAQVTRCPSLVVRRRQGSTTTLCRARNVDTGPSQSPQSSIDDDAFTEQAKDRLQKILAESSGLKNEVLDKALSELPPDEKISIAMKLTGYAVVVATITSTLCNLHPFGDLQGHTTLDHYLYGLMAAVPFIALRAFSQLESFPDTAQQYIFTEEEKLGNLLANLSIGETLLVSTITSIGISAAVFPGLIGCLSSIIQACANAFLGGGGRESIQSFTLALCIVSTIVGLYSYSVCCVSEEEASKVFEAVDNADRYYEFITPSDLGPQAAQRHSEAFKEVSRSWLIDNGFMCMSGAALKFFETVCGGILWKVTGDVSVTFACFLFVHLHLAYRAKSKVIA